MSLNVHGGLNGNQLKMLALITMTIDHIGMVMLPQFVILRVIGRLAMPLFAYMIAEGCIYTRNRPRYLATIAVTALICQITVYAAMRMLEQCILVTFTLSIIMCFAVERAIKRPSVASTFLAVVAFLASWAFCECLPLVVDGFSVDYGFAGTILPVLVFLGRTKLQKLLLMAGGLVGVAFSLTHLTVQWFALLAIIPLFFYNGKRGKLNLKYLFYVYYPLHLVAIYGLDRWL